jgi:hypothetical protein
VSYVKDIAIGLVCVGLNDDIPSIIISANIVLEKTPLQ